MVEVTSTPPAGGGKDLLAASILATAEIAMGLLSNRYSSQLPLISILLMCAIPLILSLIWLVRREREKGMLSRMFGRHPYSYSFIALIAVIFFWDMGSILTSRIGTTLKEKHITGAAQAAVPSAGAEQPPAAPETKPNRSPAAAPAPTSKPQVKPVPHPAPTLTPPRPQQRGKRKLMNSRLSSNLNIRAASPTRPS